jgi:acetyl/propionyl-CoA carboxylase alpha subunit
VSPRRLVIANRGEIARRILGAGRALGYTVAVVSTPEDGDARVRREADAVLAVPSFLDPEAIVAASREWGAQVLHPGYGFLSEDAGFAQAVEAAGIAFAGPGPEAMLALGRKEPAKALARSCGVPVLEALLSGELAALAPDRWEEALAARGIVPPYLVKASGGGGGRGMRLVAAAKDLPQAVRRAAGEAEAAFHDGTVFVERYLDAPRHVEAQVFGDGRGGGVFLGERECSLQRRHQKVLEEAPSPAAGPALREALGRAALDLVRATRYRSAGTVEFLVDGEGRFYFLEVNARLQVEHPVTELAYGVDLVRAQLELAEGCWPRALGDPGTFRVPVPDGVALEARILAEDPRSGFLPTPGPLPLYREPAGPGLRVDSGVAQGDRVNPQYDSMIAKLIVHAPDRPAAVARLSAALADFVILGCSTNLPLLQAVSRHPDYLAGRESTRWLGDHLEALNRPLLPAPFQAFLASAGFRETLADALRGLGRPAPGPVQRFAALADPELVIGGARDQPPFVLAPGDRPGWFTLGGPVLASAPGAGDPGAPVAMAACRLNGTDLAVAVAGETLTLTDPTARLAAPRSHGHGDDGPVLAPMAGRILEVHAAPGDRVEPGQLLFVLESMKMQFEVSAPRPGRVAAVLVVPGQVLQGPEPLAVLAG